MRIYVVGGRLYKVEQADDSDDWVEEDGDYISTKALRELTRFATFIMEYDYECDEYWVLKKNRYSGEELEFHNFDDALEYCQQVWPETQRHKGMLSLNCDEEVFGLISRISPLAGNRLIKE